MQGNFETMAHRIRRARAAAKLTQEQVADSIGVSAAAVAQWESGDSKNLRPANLFKLARCVKKSAEWLATGVGHEDLTEDLNDVVGELPPEERQQSSISSNTRSRKRRRLSASSASRTIEP